MRKLTNPLFLLLFVVVPYLALAYYALPAAGLVSAVIFVALFAKIRKNEFVSKKYLWFIALYNAVFIFVQIAFFYTSELMFFYLVAVPALYSVVSLAYSTKIHSVDEASNSAPAKQNVLHYVAGVILLPVLMFIAISILSGLNAEGFSVVILIAAAYIMFYLMAKIFFVMRRNPKQEVLELHTPMSRKQIITSIVLGIAAPLIGLYVNASFYYGFHGGGIFGDFSSPIFYVIAALNGILLVLPHSKNVNIRLLMFFFKSVGYTYALYFFAVFLPYLPLGVIGLIIVLGILVFAPAALTFWQSKILLNEFKLLKNYFNKTILYVVFFIGIFSLPICFYVSIYNDRANIETAALYIDDANTSKDVNVNKLQRSLTFLEGDYNIRHNNIGIFELGYFKGETPIISGLYKNIVMKNQTLSIDNITLLKQIFIDYEFNEQNVSSTQASQMNKDVTVNHISTETIFDNEIGAYRTWVNLKLKGNSNGNTEFSEVFTLPEGVYVSDYYLDVFGERKYGMLTDESAALFIYNKIVSTSRDPGLLRYIGDNQLQLNVFPFLVNEVRETGFELLHLSEFELSIGGKKVYIKGNSNFEEITAGGATLLSAAKIESLPQITREPEYNFVIDCSENSDINWQKEQVKLYCANNNITDANIYFTSYKTTEAKLKNIDKVKIKQQGGFNLNRAIRSILKDTANSHVPIIIAVTDNIGAAVLPNQNAFPSTEVLAGRFPESPYYYTLENNLVLTPRSFSNNESGATAKKPTLHKAADYNGYAVAADGKDKLIASGESLHNQTGNQYTDAMLLHSQNLKPEVTTTDYIRSSFRSRILTPKTAFIVLETAEQEKELLALQEQILNENYEVNNNQTSQQIPLAEPEIILLVIGGIAIVLKARKRAEKS